MFPIAPRLKNPHSPIRWHQEFIDAVAPYNLVTSSLLSTKEYQISPNYLPKKLYRYSPYCKTYVEKACCNSLHFSKPDNINDPYDLYANIDAIKILEWVASLYGRSDALDMITSLNLGRVQTEEHILKKFFNNIQGIYKECVLQRSCDELYECINFIFKSNFKSEMRYASFSENNDSSPMWAYYAYRHTGYCLEYDVHDDALGSLNLKSNDKYLTFMPVVYTDTPFDGNEYLRQTKAMEVGLNEVGKYAFALMVILCLQKISAWSHEKEWRLISKDYPVKLSGIHAGLKMSDSNFRELEEQAKRFNIPFYRTGVDKKNFQLSSSRDTEDLFPR